MATRNIQKYNATVTFADGTTATAEGLGESYVDKNGNVVTILARDKFEEMVKSLYFGEVVSARVLDGDGLVTTVKLGQIKSIVLNSVNEFNKTYDF